MTDVDNLRQKIDDMREDVRSQREDFAELRKYVEQLAASQIRIESMFVSQQELYNRLQDYTIQMNLLSTRITRVETYIILLGSAIAILATACLPLILERIL